MYRITSDLHGNIHPYGQPQPGIDIRITYQQPCPDRKAQRQYESILARQLLIAQLEEIYRQPYTMETLPLAKTHLGKPYLASTLPAPPISLGHSQGWAASGISLGNAPISLLGVDIEAVRNRKWDLFTTAVFHPVELEWVMSAQGMERNRRGLTVWCCKEAVLKAAGIGIALPLTEIAFSPKCALIELPASLGRKEDWKLISDTVGIHDQQAIFSVAWKVGETPEVV